MMLVCFSMVYPVDGSPSQPKKSKRSTPKLSADACGVHHSGKTKNIGSQWNYQTMLPVAVYTSTRHDMPASVVNLGPSTYRLHRYVVDGG